MPVRKPQQEEEGFVLGAKGVFIAILIAATVGAFAWQFSTLQGVTLELTRVTTTVQNMNQNLAIFATKEELKRVEQKIDTHIIEGDRRYSELKSKR